MKPTNLLEILDAGISGVSRWKEDFADGRQTLLEKAAWLKEYKPIRQAVEGIAEVPKELWNLDQEGMQEIQGRVNVLLVAFGFSHRSRDIAYIIVRATHRLAQDVKEALSLPPTAEPVE